MDAEMKKEEFTDTYPVWDLNVEDNIVPILEGDKEDAQTALMASVLQQGSIPQLLEQGVPWADYLTGDITFGELDVYIRESIGKAGKEEYRPDYEINGDRLTVKVTKEL